MKAPEPVRHTLESVAASVEPATETEDFERIIREAKEERAQRRAQQRDVEP